MEENKVDLVKAILKVMKDCRNIDKNLSVGTGNSGYKGVSDADVKLKVGDSMAKHGLCILPIDYDSKVTCSEFEQNYNGNKKMVQSYFTEVNAKYILMHESGQSMQIAGYGHGIDRGDKGAGKATTYSMKNALLYSHMIATGSIDDTDTTYSDDLGNTRPFNGISHPNIDSYATGDELCKQIKNVILTISKSIEPLAPMQPEELDNYTEQALRDMLKESMSCERDLNAEKWIDQQMGMPKKSGSIDALRELVKEAKRRGFYTPSVELKLKQKADEYKAVENAG